MNEQGEWWNSLLMATLRFHCSRFTASNRATTCFSHEQIEVVSKQTAQSGKASKAANLQKLIRKIKACEVESYFDKAAALIRSETSAYEWPNQTGYSYYFPDTNRLRYAIQSRVSIRFDNLRPCRLRMADYAFGSNRRCGLAHPRHHRRTAPLLFCRANSRNLALICANRPGGMKP